MGIWVAAQVIIPNGRTTAASEQTKYSAANRECCASATSVGWTAGASKKMLHARMHTAKCIWRAIAGASLRNCTRAIATTTKWKLITFYVSFNVANGNGANLVYSAFVRQRSNATQCTKVSSCPPQSWVNAQACCHCRVRSPHGIALRCIFADISLKTPCDGQLWLKALCSLDSSSPYCSSLSFAFYSAVFFLPPYSSHRMWWRWRHRESATRTKTINIKCSVLKLKECVTKMVCWPRNHVRAIASHRIDAIFYNRRNMTATDITFLFPFHRDIQTAFTCTFDILVGAWDHWFMHNNCHFENGTSARVTRRASRWQCTGNRTGDRPETMLASNFNAIAPERQTLSRPKAAKTRTKHANEATESSGAHRRE